jgi:hypothetical protein
VRDAFEGELEGVAEQSERALASESIAVIKEKLSIAVIEGKLEQSVGERIHRSHRSYSGRMEKEEQYRTNIRKVSSSLLMLRLLLGEKARQRDNLGINLRCSDGRADVAFAVGSHDAIVD